MKTYQVNGKSYTQDEIITIHAMWQGILDRDNINGCVELALATIGNDQVSEYVRNNEQDIIERCLQTLPEWGVQHDECLSYNCLLHQYFVADKMKEIYESYRAGGDE